MNAENKDYLELLSKVERIAKESSNALTKREMFAMAAMQGILAKDSWLQRLDLEESKNSLRHQIASVSVRMADELLKALDS